MTEVWFIRHGESTANAGAISADIQNIPLTAKGIAQAENVAAQFKIAPDLIITTPFIRTGQTAEPLMQRYPSARHEEWPLQEFTYLSAVKYANTTSDERRPHALKYWAMLDPNFMDDNSSESFNMLLARINTSLTKLQQRDEKFIVIYCHGLIMQVMRMMVARPELAPKELMQLFQDYQTHNEVVNTQIIRLDITKDKIVLQPKDQALFEAGLSHLSNGLATLAVRNT